MSDLFYTPNEVEREPDDGLNLIIPSSFQDALSYAQQIIWLYFNKQDKLVEGDNITLTPNSDGTVTITATVEGGQDGRGIKSITGVVGDEGTTVTVTLTDNTTQTFFVQRGPAGPQGAQGVQGPTGPQGVQGPQGERGPQGEQGVQGEQGIQGETGPAGATGPQGETGPAGPTGAQGPQGPAGQDGTNGVDGKNGNRIWNTTDDYTTPNYTFDIADLDGQSGETPLAGDYVIQNVNHRTYLFFINSVSSTTVLCDYYCELTGATGPQGPQGIPGSGEDGVGISDITYTREDANGNYVYTVTLSNNQTYEITCPRGPQGIQGPAGATGATGPQGPAGNDGSDGISPTVTVTSITGGHHVEIVSAGGTEYFDVMDGTDGATGPQGPQGIQGVQGETGPQGPQGIQGEQGPAGQNGTNGTNGTDGVSPTVSVTSITGGHTVNITDAQGQHPFNVMDGADGATGATGPQGPAGPGVPQGGTAGQVLAKVDGTDYNTEWITPSGGGGSTDVIQVTAQHGSITFPSGYTSIYGWLNMTDIFNVSNKKCLIAFANGQLGFRVSSNTGEIASNPTGFNVNLYVPVPEDYRTYPFSSRGIAIISDEITDGYSATRKDFCRVAAVNIYKGSNSVSMSVQLQLMPNINETSGYFFATGKDYYISFS